MNAGRFSTYKHAADCAYAVQLVGPVICIPIIVGLGLLMAKDH